MTMFVEVCYVVSDDAGRMLVNGSYGMLTHSLITAKKWKDHGKAQKRCDAQNVITASPTITTSLRGVTFKVVPVELKAVPG